MFLVIFGCSTLLNTLAVSLRYKKNRKYNKLKSSNYENIRLYPFRRISGK